MSEMLKRSLTSSPYVSFGIGLFKPRTFMGRYVRNWKRAA